MNTQSKKNHKDIVRFLTELEAFACTACMDGDRRICDPSVPFKFPVKVYTGRIDRDVDLPTLLNLYNVRNAIDSGNMDAEKNHNRKATSQAIVRRAISMEWKYVRNINYANILIQLLPEEYRPAIVSDLDTTNWELNYYCVPVEFGFVDELVIYY